MAAALPAAGSPRPVPSAARGAHALLRLASPGPRAASPMPFSGEERSLQGIYKPAAPAEGRATGGATVCTECYTNRSFVYDDGSARRYPPAGGGGGLALGVAGLGGDGRGPPVLPRSPPGPRGAAPSTAAGTPRGEPGSARQDPRPAFPPPFPWPEPGRKVSATLPGPVWGPPRTPLRAASPGEWGSERLPGRRGCLEIPELFPVVSFVGKGWMLPLRRA